MEKQADQHESRLAAVTEGCEQERTEMQGKLQASQAVIAVLKDSASAAEQRESTLRADLQGLQAASPCVCVGWCPS